MLCGLTVGSGAFASTATTSFAAAQSVDSTFSFFSASAWATQRMSKYAAKQSAHRSYMQSPVHRIDKTPSHIDAWHPSQLKPVVPPVKCTARGWPSGQHTSGTVTDTKSSGGALAL